MFSRRPQEDFESEIRAHLELEVDRLRALGMTPGEAERTARRNFGNVGATGDRFYHAQRFASVQDFGRDLRHAWRGLRRTPGFLVTAAGTLALAIGAVAGMVNVVSTVLLEPLPFPDHGRLVAIEGTAPGSDLPPEFSLGAEFYLHYRDQSRLLAGIFTFAGGTATFRADERVERIPMAWPTNDMYATLGVRPILGRLPVAEDGDDAVVISDQLWSNWFGRDSAVLGKWYFVSDSMKQVVGIMPPDFRFPADETQLWVSGEIGLEQIQLGALGNRVVARMKPGVTSDQVATELTTLARGLPERFGGEQRYVTFIGQFRAVVAPLLDSMLGPRVRSSLWVLLGAVAVVLLIACANVANLFLVRAESRRRDMTVRRAIGASRTQLVRFQLAEALAVALAGGIVAIALAFVTLPVFVRAAPDDVPRLDQVGLDARAVLVAIGVVIVVTLLCGVVPALRASAPDLAGLRDGGRGSTGRRPWVRDGLVVAQTALALVLLIGSALLLQSFRQLRNVDPGYQVRDRYTFQYAPQQDHLRDGPSLGRLHRTMMDRLLALPGVTGVGIVNNIPLDEGTNPVRVTAEGMSPGADGGVPMGLNFTGGDYFRVMEIALLEGRPFTTAEAETPNTSVVISRSGASRLWPGQSAVGRRLRVRIGRLDTTTFTVVGVVADVKQLDWRDTDAPTMYLPLTGPTATAWGMGSPAYVVKSPRAAQLRNEVRALVRELTPEAPVYREFTLEFLARRSMTELAFTALTLGVVSVLALLLGAIGLYGVLSYVVAERTREIGLRMALGATAARVRRMVVSQGMAVVLVGVAAGTFVAALTTRYLERLLFDVTALEPMVFAGMGAMMLAVGIVASYVPARRASSVDPIESLRGD